MLARAPSATSAQLRNRSGASGRSQKSSLSDDGWGEVMEDDQPALGAAVDDLRVLRLAASTSPGRGLHPGPLETQPEAVAPGCLIRASSGRSQNPTASPEGSTRPTCSHRSQLIARLAPPVVPSIWNRGGPPRVKPESFTSGCPPPDSRSRAASTGRASRVTTGCDGAGRAGRTLGQHGRVLGATGGSPGSGRRTRVRQLPAGSRVGPGGAAPGEVDDGALARYAEIIDGCTQRRLEPLVTLHHFTHPSWLGEDFWLRPDAPERFRDWAEVALGALADKARLWVTINEINVLAIQSWLLGFFPPGRFVAFADAAVAVDHLLAAHVLAYEAIHRARPDAVVTTNNACVSVYDFDRRLTDVLMARSLGVARHEIDGWMAQRRAEHDAGLPAPGPGSAPFAASGRWRRRSDRGHAGALDPGGPARVRAHTGPSMLSTPAPPSRPSTSSVSTTTTRWWPGTSGLPPIAPPVAGGGCRPGSCGTTSPIRPVSPGGSTYRPRPLPAPRCGWWRTDSATG